MWAPSHGMNLTLNQTLVSHSHKFCATIVSAHLASRDAWISLGWGSRIDPEGSLRESKDGGRSGGEGMEEDSAGRNS